jgi:dihydroxyacetone kinase
MKLAETWIEDAPIPTAVAAFHDEVEEVDEVDEAKDGCGGVVWQPYVLKRAHTRNKMLHELAREIRGVEKRRGKNGRGSIQSYFRQMGIGLEALLATGP